MKLVSRLIMLVLLAAFLPTELWAQQKPSSSKLPPVEQKSHRQLIEEGLIDFPSPREEGFHWKNYGSNPAIPTAWIPENYGKGDLAYDRIVLLQLAEGIKGDANITDEQVLKRKDIFWVSVWSIVGEPGTEIPQRFRDDLLNLIRFSKWSITHFDKGYVFSQCRMASGDTAADGRHVAMVTGPPIIDFDGGIDAYVFEPILMKDGPLTDFDVALVLPTKCFNFTCLYVQTTRVSEKLPVPPPPPPPAVSTLRVNKEWINGLNGKKLDAPARTAAQLAFKAVPKEGEALTVQAYDNKHVEFTFPVGTELSITEVLDNESAKLWRTDGLSEIRVKLGEDNKPITFRNASIITNTTSAVVPVVVPPPPPPRRERIVERYIEGRKSHKKLWYTIGGVAVGTAVALVLATRNHETTNIYQDGYKGAGSNSSNPGGTAGGGTAGGTTAALMSFGSSIRF